MNKLKFFCFMKNVLVAAKNAGWEHQPQRDRYICDIVDFSFSKFENGNEVAVLDIAFDVAANDIIKSAVAGWETKDGARMLNAKNIPFVSVEKLFDPNSYLTFGSMKQD